MEIRRKNLFDNKHYISIMSSTILIISILLIFSFVSLLEEANNNKNGITGNIIKESKIKPTQSPSPEPIYPIQAEIIFYGMQIFITGIFTLLTCRKIRKVILKR